LDLYSRRRMKRKYKLNDFNLPIDPIYCIELAKKAYNDKFPNQKIDDEFPFAYCLIYLVIDDHKNFNLSFYFPQNFKLIMRGIAKNPKGFSPGKIVTTLDIREYTFIKIPPYNSKYYYDFILIIFDPVTRGYWTTNLWTAKICLDRRYYMSRKRKYEYYKIGIDLASGYNITAVLGWTNLKTMKLRTDKFIKKLIRSGWIPNFSLFPHPYGTMLYKASNNSDQEEIDNYAVEYINKHVLDTLSNRWGSISLAQSRMIIFNNAIGYYKKGDFVSPIYLLLPQIEGLISDHIRRNKLHLPVSFENKVNYFRDIILKSKYNTNFTKDMTVILHKYLQTTFYRKWFQATLPNKKFRKDTPAPQRHVVLHGAFSYKYFTPANCLKIICTLDSILLLSLRKSELPRRNFR